MRTLLDATAQVLADVGIDKASTNKIARQANVAVGSIYQYFPNKEALIDALVEDRMQRLGDLVRTRMAALESSTFPAAAEAMLRAVIEFLRREPGLVPVLMTHAFSVSDKGVAGQLRAESESLARAFLEQLDDRAVPDLDIAVFVSTNVAGLLGALLASPGIDDGYRERAVAEIVRMLSSWMSPPR
ncbi:MAG TPA: TetR/AcrR family transcriptional regulator [Acidimicrobiales bacterium]|nr:TetR/AcrR family transcriptional regulator [Acidimicrobiales bacterium]